MSRRTTLEIQRLQVDPEDIVMKKEDAKPGDIVIPIMGPTGVGKSSFVNNVLRGASSSPEAVISDGYSSCTVRAKHYAVDVPRTSRHAQEFAQRRIILLDTPGFDDTQLSDGEILRRIAVWLSTSYDADMRVGGLVYIYPIFPRASPTCLASVDLFMRLCGKNNTSRIVLAGTRWNLCPEEQAKERQREIADTFWTRMGGALSLPEAPCIVDKMPRRLENTPESAWAIIDEILTHLSAQGAWNDKRSAPLQLQAELVDKNKFLGDTSAGRVLRSKVNREISAARRISDPEERKVRLKELDQELSMLRAPLASRIQRWIGTMYAQSRKIQEDKT